MADNQSPDICVINRASLGGSKGGRPLRPFKITDGLYNELRQLTLEGTCPDWTLLGRDANGKSNPAPIFWTLLSPEIDWFEQWATDTGAKVLTPEEWNELLRPISQTETE